MKRRLLSLMLAAALVLGLAAPALAYTTPDFADVPSNHWAYESVMKMADAGVIKGTGAGQFSPDMKLSAEMFIVLVGRVVFPDVKAEGADWSGPYVAEAKAKGLLEGTNITDGNLKGEISRYDMAVILAKCVEILKVSATKADSSKVTDYGEVPAKYIDAVLMAYGSGLIRGDQSGSFNGANSMTRQEAATVMDRLLSFMSASESGSRSDGAAGTSTAAAVLSDKEKTQLENALQKKIAAIQSAKTEIVHSDRYIPGETYTGTAYYVSNDGDDMSDGRTPETAWRTPLRVLEALGFFGRTELKPGDAVFFRRGDTFRMEETQFWNIIVSNLTFSAYGEGDKPVITGSSENGDGAEKWKLVYEDGTGKKIWQFYRDMTDVSMLVLNDGEDFTTRVYEYYTDHGYVSCEMYDWWMHTEDCLTLKDELLSLEESMAEDLSIISRPERSDERMITSGVGPLYVRCDSGNPGEIYSSVEFSQYHVTGLVSLQACGVVFDNLSFRCGGNSFIKSGLKWKEITDTRIQNCEFAYGGGCVTLYHAISGGKPLMEPQGDGIYNIVRNTLIQNNYFHDMMSSTVTYEGDDFNDKDAVGGSYHFLDNVCVNTMGVRLDSTAGALQYLDSVVVRGNQLWNTGHMDNGKFVYSEGSLVMMPNHYGECIIEDNVFYGTEQGHPMNALLDIFSYDFEGGGYTRPQLRGNVYAQYSGRNFGDFLYQNGETWSIDDPDLSRKAAGLLGDATGRFYVIP